MSRVSGLLCLPLLLAAEAGALGDSNLALVSRAAAQAVDAAVTDLDAGDDGGLQQVLVVPATKHDANWLVQHLLVQELLRRGLEVNLDSTVTGASRLSYRVVEVVVSGRSALLSNAVERRCRVGVQLDFSRDGERLWTGEGHAELHDRIAKGELDALQHSRFSFAATEVEERTWGKYVEPVIVSTVLGSLVYLFFSNR